MPRRERRVDTVAAAPAVCQVLYAVPRRGLPATLSFRRWVGATLESVRPVVRAECAIRIVGAQEGQALNSTFRQADHATNVLSFPAQLPKGTPQAWLGDIVLCAPVVAREARAQGKPVQAHYAHLTVHAVLHLLGFDHERARAAADMEKLECRVLAGMGFPDPYATR